MRDGSCAPFFAGPKIGGFVFEKDEKDEKKGV